MSEERLLSVLNESESVKECGKNFDDASIEKILINWEIDFLSQK